jgi:hypothetical protein
MDNNLELWVYTHNNKLKGKNVFGQGIVRFPLSQKKGAFKLFLEYMEKAGKYGKPFITLQGVSGYVPDFDATPSKHEIRTGYAGKFSHERMFNEWLEENIQGQNLSTVESGKF